MPFRIGLGLDLHRLAAGRPLMLGGIKIKHALGAVGHSDADVLLHALCDALLGALALGDIGQHFPNSNPAYKNIASTRLLKKVCALVTKKGFVIGNIDAVVQLERPQLAPYMERIRKQLAKCLAIPMDSISVKATTGEGIGIIGREAGIAAQVVALLIKQ